MLLDGLFLQMTWSLPKIFRPAAYPWCHWSMTSEKDLCLATDDIMCSQKGQTFLWLHTFSSFLPLLSHHCDEADRPVVGCLLNSVIRYNSEIYSRCEGPEVSNTQGQVNMGSWKHGEKKLSLKTKEQVWAMLSIRMSRWFFGSEESKGTIWANWK